MMAVTISLSWTPFAAHGMTVARTKRLLQWAYQQIELVCDVNYVPATTQRGDIHVHPLHSNHVGGQAYKYDVYISTLRNMTGREGYVMGGVALHEFLHAWPFRWGHTISINHRDVATRQRDYIMHPYGSRDDWFHPSEVIALQNRFGKPKQLFRVHELWFVGNTLRKLREDRKRFAAERQSWADRRDAEIQTKLRQEYNRQVILWQREVKKVNTKIQKAAGRWFEVRDLWAEVPQAKVPGPKAGRTRLDVVPGPRAAQEVSEDEAGCGCENAYPPPEGLPHWTVDVEKSESLV